MQDEENLKELLIHFVQEFGTQWNKIEREINIKNDAEKDCDIKTNWFAIIKALRYPLYEKYCTD